mgnify:CR=1 FL=1
MNYRLIIFITVAFILIFPHISDAAVFRDRELSSSCGINAVLGKNVEIYITAKNTQTTSQQQRLELVWVSTAGGNIFFEESDSSVLEINLLPQEKKIYKAIFSASETGEHQLKLTTDEAQPSVIEVAVVPSPEFSEMGLILPVIIIILSVFLFRINESE